MSRRGKLNKQRCRENIHGNLLKLGFAPLGFESRKAERGRDIPGGPDQPPTEAYGLGEGLEKHQKSPRGGKRTRRKEAG